MGREIERWDPWAALGLRGHIRFALEPLPEATGGAVYGARGDQAVIVIDPGSSRVVRRCDLAHELVHDERGGHDHDDVPERWLPVLAREERHIDRIVAGRLVPGPELEVFTARKASVDEGVTAADIAEEFDVTDRVAERAARRLLDGQP